MKERTLNCLIGITRENYRVQQALSFIADIKSDDSIDEETRTRFIAYADALVELELGMTQEGLAMLKEFGGSANIEPNKELEEEADGFY